MNLGRKKRSDEGAKLYNTKLDWKPTCSEISAIYYIIKLMIQHYKSPNLDWVTDFLSLKQLKNKVLCYWKKEEIVRDSSPKNGNSVIIYSPTSSSKPVWMTLFCWTQNRIFWRKFVTRLFWGTIDFYSRKKNTMEVNSAPELLCFSHSSEYLPLCSAEQRHSYRFGTTWWWANDRIVIFGWNIPLT